MLRPSQTLAHSYAIDFFAWPGVRERFVFAQHRYCSNSFWHLFCRSFHLLWPYEFRDTYTYNTITQEYKISSGFEERMQDINTWTMSRDIFERWPEFYSDFPAWGHMPMTIDSPRPARSRQANRAIDRAPDSTGRSVTNGSMHATPVAGSPAHSNKANYASRTGVVEELDDSGPQEIYHEPPVTSGIADNSLHIFNYQPYNGWGHASMQVDATHYDMLGPAAGKNMDFGMPFASVPQDGMNVMGHVYNPPI